MINLSIITNKGKNIILNRAYKSTPDYNQPSLFQLGTTQPTPLLTSTTIPSPVTLATGTTKTFVTNYPSINESLKEVTIRGYVSSTEANGESIDGSGLLTAESELFSMDKFNDESKSATDEFAFIFVDRIL